MNEGIKRRILRWVSLAVILAGFGWALIPPAPENGEEAAAAQGREPSAPAEDVRYTIKVVVGPQYTPGSVPFGIGEPLQGFAEVIRAFESRFPDTRIDIVTAPVLLREYLVTQLSSGDAPDIVCVNVEDVWVDVQKQWYIPLDAFLEAPNEFVREQGDPAAPGYDQWWDMFKYQAISRGKAAPDGKMYCLSFDMVETGIFYNRNIFAALNLAPPETWDQFLHVLATIKATRVQVEPGAPPRAVTPLLMITDMFTDWTTDLLFDQLYYCLLPGIDLYQDPKREAYLEGYLDDFEIDYLFRKGFFTQEDPRYREIWRIMHGLRQYTSENMVSTDLNREFVTQSAATVWHSTPFVYRLTADAELGFDWGVFYMPPLTRASSEYACGTPMCVIGGAAAQYEITNTAISDTPADMPFEQRIAQSQRLKRVVQFLQFATVPKHYERIVNEYECFLPNIVGVGALPALQPFVEILERRYTTTKWAFTYDLKFYEILRRMLELYLNDGVTLDEFMDWQISNLEAATTNFRARKGIDDSVLDRAWAERAPARALMEDLPDGAT